mmetsp:Transcript_15100/g.39952  ORF Transcript_15100/g.39952 Transcript_15100/m.39952 type:complete len:347 (+) Transcript_15100:536-1576(+)
MMSMAIWTASSPAVASAMASSLSAFSFARMASAFSRLALSSATSEDNTLSSSESLSRRASDPAIWAFSSVIFSAAYPRFCSAADVALSHHAFWSASLDCCASKRSISSWMSCLTLTNGSAEDTPAIWVARAISSELRSFCPWLFSMSMMASRPLAAAAALSASVCGACRLCRKLGASAASAAASAASMKPGDAASRLANLRDTAFWLKRTVAAVVLLATASPITPSTWVSIEISSWRACARWSHVAFLSVHISASFSRYCWSSSSSAEVVVNCWVASPIFFALAAFVPFASSMSRLRALSLLAFSCMAASWALAARTSSSSISLRLPVKSFCSFSSVAMISSEWNL